MFVDFLEANTHNEKKIRGRLRIVMFRVVSKFLILLCFWILLSGQIDMHEAGDRFLLACGVVSCIFVTYLTHRKGILDEEGHPIHLALAILAYFPWLLWQIVLANLDVAYRVWQPRLNISPRMVRIPYSTKTPVATVVYANSITLTPGTVTVSVDEQKGEMLVHALTDKSAASLLSGTMQDRIHKLEG